MGWLFIFQCFVKPVMAIEGWSYLEDNILTVEYDSSYSNDSTSMVIGDQDIQPEIDQTWLNCFEINGLHSTQGIYHVINLNNGYKQL
jgi:hypothetical protein